MRNRDPTNKKTLLVCVAVSTATYVGAGVTECV
jgi:hypothetical protein